jgi:mannitol/fructose-specific phosphotransferase system IIA component (Ntr-type)
LSVNVESSTELIARPDVVVLDLAVNSRESALRALHQAILQQPGVTDGDRLLRDVLERVMVAPVCIASDVALPHARTTAVERIVLGVARLQEPGVGFDGEHPNIRLIFMIGTPRNQVEEYLRLVAAITRLLRKPGARAALLAAPNETEFRAVLAGGAAT